jgi:hypothetical protein
MHNFSLGFVQENFIVSLFRTHELFLEHGTYKLVKGQNSHDSVIDAAIQIIQKSSLKHVNLEKQLLRNILLNFAFLKAAGIADINIPDELDESFLYELVEKFGKHKTDKFPSSTCTGHFDYLGEGSPNFDSIESLMTYWESKVSDQHFVLNIHFCELLAHLLKLSILVWIPIVSSPGVYWCSKVFGSQYMDYCFVAYKPYDLDVTVKGLRSPGGVPQHWTMNENDIISAANYFCPIEMHQTKIRIIERKTTINDADVVVAIHDNHHSIKDMTLLDYFTICQMRNNVYIHPIDYASSSSKVKNTVFQQTGLSYITSCYFFNISHFKNQLYTSHRKLE